jgi:cytochrome c553
MPRVRSIARALVLTLASVAMAQVATANPKGDRALGEYLSAECVTCHQLSGRVVGGVPAIIGIDIESFVALMNSYKNKERENEVMRTIAAKFSDEDILALATYFESIKPQK